MRPMTDLKIVPATVERFDDLASLVGAPDPATPACWCLTSRLTSGEFASLTGAERPARLRELCTREPAPGLLAYLGERVAGWCSFGPRPELGRLLRSRTIPQLDPPDTWCIVCFVVAPHARRRGVAGSLLDAAVAYAEAHGAPAIEGYPIDNDGARVSSAFAYVGTRSMFDRAGFVRVADTQARSAKLPRVVMRRDLGGTA
jgi:GNAT superfamily N-acetyltransferase